MGPSLRAAAAAENLTLAEILDAAGYDTGAVTPHPYFEGRWGLPQGFRRHDNSPAIYNRDNRGIVSARVEIKSEAMLARLRPPFFFWAHFYDPHAHYMPRPVERFGDRDVDLYDGELVDTDAQIGKLLRWIEARRLGPTIIVICSDHGEEFGEHGGQYHGRRSTRRPSACRSSFAYRARGRGSSRSR